MNIMLKSWSRYLNSLKMCELSLLASRQGPQCLSRAKNFLVARLLLLYQFTSPTKPRDVHAIMLSYSCADEVSLGGC